MKSQKIFLLSLFFVALFLGVIKFVYNNYYSSKPSTLSTETAVVSDGQVSTVSLAPTVTDVAIIIDFGTGKKVEGKVSETTAYLALIRLASDNGWDVETKQFDFGSLVDSIGQIKNSGESAWMYYVNGKAGNVAADKYRLSSGDKVEWRFEKIK